MMNKETIKNEEEKEEKKKRGCWEREGGKVREGRGLPECLVPNECLRLKLSPDNKAGVP